MGNIRDVTSAKEIIIGYFFWSQRTCVIANNSKPPSTEEVSTKQTILRSVWKLEWKGCLDHTINHNWDTPDRIRSAPDVANMFGKRKYGTFVRYRCSQSDVSMRRPVHPVTGGGEPATNNCLISVQRSRHYRCFHFDQIYFPVNWLLVVCVKETTTDI